MAVNINRLQKYAKLLLEGAMEANIRFTDNLNEKENKISSLGSLELSQRKNEVDRLMKITEEDISLSLRIQRWVDSSESKEALKQLRRNKIIVNEINDMRLGEFITSIFNISEVGRKVLMDINKNLNNQKKVLEGHNNLLEKKSESRKVINFIKKYKTLVVKQEELFEILKTRSKEMEELYNKVKIRAFKKIIPALPLLLIYLQASSKQNYTNMDSFWNDFTVTASIVFGSIIGIIFLLWANNRDWGEERMKEGGKERMKKRRGYIEKMESGKKRVQENWGE